METIVEVLWGFWIFEFIADHPVLWITGAYGIGTAIVALMLIARDEGGVRLWLRREWQELRAETRASRYH